MTMGLKRHTNIRMWQHWWYIIIITGISWQCKPKTEHNGISVHSKPIPAFTPEPGITWYDDKTEAAGILFKHTIGDEELSNLVESVGGGAAWLDYDLDGDYDLYMVNGNYVEPLSTGEEDPVLMHNKLFRNNGDGTFEDVTKKSKTGDEGYGMGVSVGDYDNDGYPDIYISNYGPNVLLHNNGNGTFSDVTGKAGVGGKACSVGAAWLDFDHDGWLDLYVGNYINYDPDYKLYYAPDGFPGPLSYPGESDRLYRNLGNGQFEDVTEKMGVFNAEGRAMGVGAADFDLDGWVDIYVANDHMINYLYKNQQGKGFKDVAVMAGVASNQVGEATISMAVDIIDYNGDQLMDIFVSDDGYCALFKNQGNGQYTDESYPSGIAQVSGQHVGWASPFFDYDNDMDLDIFKVNGELKHLYGMEDQLFENDGTGKFAEVSVKRGGHFLRDLVGRGAAYGDYDNDGDLDIYIVNLNDFGILLQNQDGNKNSWILLNLVGTTSNRDAIGARVRVTAGGKTQISQKKSGCGYLSQNDPRIHFGLGTHETVEKIEIFWPSGKTQVLENVKARQILEVKEL